MRIHGVPFTVQGLMALIRRTTRPGRAADASSSGLVVARSMLGLLALIGAAGPARGQGQIGHPVYEPIRDARRKFTDYDELFEYLVGRPVHRPIPEERWYLTDFHTLYECLERAAREHGLAMRSSGRSSSWQAVRRGGVNEGFVVVADERRFPWLKGRALASIDGPHPGANPDAAERPKAILDLDTGVLTPPEGIDVGGWQIRRIQLGVTLTRLGTNESYQLNLARDFSDMHIKASMLSQRKGSRADCREFLVAVESKLKLASRLKEAKAKKERRPEAQEGPKRPATAKSVRNRDG